MDETTILLQKALLYGLFPLWLLAGFADYCCHRALRIEYSAGSRESVIHLLLLAELGVGFLCLLLFEINAATLAVLVAVVVLHELTTWWDLSYAASRRSIPVVEQWVHGLLEVLPWVGLAGVLLLNPEQTRALFGIGPAVADWSLRISLPDWPRPRLVAFGAAALLLTALPFAAEYRRCRRHSAAG